MDTIFTESALNTLYECKAAPNIDNGEMQEIIKYCKENARVINDGEGTFIRGKTHYNVKKVSREVVVDAHVSVKNL